MWKVNEIAAYSDWFPRDPNRKTRLKHMGNGNYKVQIRSRQFLGFSPVWMSRWINVTDTHPGHGGTVKYYNKEGAEEFHKEVRARLARP